jgi:hypothetical protein
VQYFRVKYSTDKHHQIAKSPLQRVIRYSRFRYMESTVLGLCLANIDYHILRGHVLAYCLVAAYRLQLSQARPRMFL